METAAPRTITALEIVGLKRTRTSVAEAPLKKYIGQDADTLNLKEIEGAILDLGILEVLRIDIIPHEGGQTLKVEVKEKWAIFPVPVFYYGSGRFLVGGAFYDANAFGINDKIALAGMYQDNGWMITAMYMNTPRRGRAGISGSVFYSQIEQEDTDHSDRVLRRYSMDSFNGSLALNYSFTELLGARFSLGYSNRTLRHNKHALLSPPSGGQLLRLEPSLILRRSSYDGFLLSEKNLRLSYSGNIALRDCDSFQSLRLQGIFQHSILPGFRTDLRTGLLWQPGVEPLFESGPGESEVKILPSDFSALHYAGLSLGLEKYLWKFPFGTVSLLLSWQMVYSYGSILGHQFDYGIASSLSFYLSKLAIPALGLGVAYNIPAGYFQFSMSMGMTL